MTRIFMLAIVDRHNDQAAVAMVTSWRNGDFDHNI